MFQSIFICIFVFFQSDLDIDKLVSIGMANGIAEQGNLQMSVNMDIDTLAAAKKGKIDPTSKSSVYFSINDSFGATFQNKKEKAEWEDRLTKTILEAKKKIRVPRFVTLDLFTDDPTIGQLYKVDAIRIIQITSPDSFIGRLPPLNVPRPTCYFEGFDTSKLVDNQILKPNEGGTAALLYVEGTRAYTTTTGASNTVSKIRKLNQEEVERLNQEVKARTPSIEARTWLDNSGKNKIEAVLTDFDLKRVTLTKTDGKVIQIPISTLSKEDQKIVKIELGLEPFSVPHWRAIFKTP